MIPFCLMSRVAVGISSVNNHLLTLVFSTTSIPLSGVSLQFNPQFQCFSFAPLAAGRWFFTAHYIDPLVPPSFLLIPQALLAPPPPPPPTHTQYSSLPMSNILHPSNTRIQPDWGCQRTTRNHFPFSSTPSLTPTRKLSTHSTDLAPTFSPSVSRGPPG